MSLVRTLLQWAMRATRPAAVLAWLGLSLAAPRAVVGQEIPALRPIWRADLFATTRDLRRGIRNNAFILGQADAMLGIGRAGTSLTAGGWAAVEPRGTKGEARADLRAGPAGVSDASGWIQLAHRTGRVTVSAGVLRDWYRRMGSDPAVTELYAAARLQAGRWTSALSAWQAVAGADGLYLEPSLAWHHLANPFTGPSLIWTSTLTAGFQIGERNPDGGAKVPGPVGTGLTHVVLGTGVRGGLALAGSLTLVAALGLELQGSRDPATRLRRDGTRSGWLRFRTPLQLGLSYPLRRPE